MLQRPIWLSALAIVGLGLLLYVVARLDVLPIGDLLVICLAGLAIVVVFEVRRRRRRRRGVR